MNKLTENPREPFNRLFDQFNDMFARTAALEGFIFDPRSGPNISRALRRDEGRLKRGVFLEIKKHWMESDPFDPDVTLTYGVWLLPEQDKLPFYLLVKTFFEGNLRGISNIEKTLNLAAIEVKAVSEEMVIKNGKLLKDSPV